MTDIVCLPVFSGLLFFTAFFLYQAVIRYIEYREKVGLVERRVLEVRRVAWYDHENERDALIWGIMLTVLGVVLTVPLQWLGLSLGAAYGLGPWSVGGLIPLFIGIGLLGLYFATRKRKSRRNTPEGSRSGTGA